MGFTLKQPKCMRELWFDLCHSITGVYPHWRRYFYFISCSVFITWCLCCELNRKLLISHYPSSSWTVFEQQVESTFKIKFCIWFDCLEERRLLQQRIFHLSNYLCDDRTRPLRVTVLICLVAWGQVMWWEGGTWSLYCQRWLENLFIIVGSCLCDAGVGAGTYCLALELLWVVYV